MPQVGERPVAFVVVALALVIATVTDLRERRVPLWLTVSGIAAGLTAAAAVQLLGAQLPAWGASGYVDLRESGLGLLAGLLILSPFVLIGLARGQDAVG